MAGLMGRPKYSNELAADLKRLESRLTSLCAGQVKAHVAGQLRILNLACGECHEAEMLDRLMRDLRASETTTRGREALEVEFVGLDIREAEIARAAERCRTDRSTRFRFLAKDGKHLSSTPELAGEFDVVFVRHQNCYLGSREWQELFEKSLEKLAPNGRLIITSYFDHEHELAKAAIGGVGGQLLGEVANTEARALSVPGKFVDKRLALFRRQP